MQNHVSELFSPYLDDRVTPEERSAVDSHLASCVACRTELDELRALTQALRRLPQHTPPRSFTLGPRAMGPAALSGTAAGFLRAVTSIAAALAVVAVSLSLILQGL
ncbi:MAG TPA: zf-HC2 domain-containing protein, partial [Chloroflexota bacterium]|nr:zf-HC2 domain-containing protein [Chloroflexota bacterium]